MEIIRLEVLNKCFYVCFIIEGAFTMEFEGAGINVGKILYVEVVNPSILFVSISTPRNWISLLILISCVKLRTKLF